MVDSGFVEMEVLRQLFSMGHGDEGERVEPYL
jgi:L-fucose mutarotase/ribose pyranase (RbsD/FucU family)